MDKSLEFKEKLSSGFNSLEASLNGGSKLPLHEIRKNSLKFFLEANYPTLKDEEWKYTNLTGLLDLNFEFPENKSSLLVESELEMFLSEREKYYNLVFINGVFSPESSDLIKFNGIIVSDLKFAVKNYYNLIEPYLGKIISPEFTIFTALNSAYINEGVFIHAHKNKVLDRPIRIVYFNNSDRNYIYQPRNLFLLEENSQVKVIEVYASSNESTYFTNSVTEGLVEDRAILEHIKLQQESKSAFHITATDISVKKEAQYHAYNVAFGSILTRNDINARFAGEYSEITLNGLFLGSGKQLIDNHTLIDHAVPNCRSHQLYKGVLNGMSRGVFNGKVMVRKDAQKTNAFQENKTILMSDDARIDTKPQLEIFADDVKCTHGATIGRLNEESIFYLRSRGFGLELARTTLINAFATDAVHTITMDDIRNQIEEMIAANLPS